MLRTFGVLLAFCLVSCFVTCLLPMSSANECRTNTVTSGSYDSGTVSVCVSDVTSSGGSDGSGSGETGGGSAMCVNWFAVVIPCWQEGYWWSDHFGAYCKVDEVLYDDRGKVTGANYECWTPFVHKLRFWGPYYPSTPGTGGVSPESVVRTAMVSLGLRAPVVNVGAYVYPGFEQWGLSWWVRAPMWLWIDKGDDLQWGTHTVTDTDLGLTVTATVKAVKATWDMGDGSAPIACPNPGTPRPWNPNELMERSSPTGCQHRYMATNTLGDVNSRYLISTTVTWEVTWWTNDGQYGMFTHLMVSSSSASVHVGELYVVSVPVPPIGDR